MHFLDLLLLFKIAPSFVCSSCHYLNYLKNLYLCLCSLQLPYLRWKRSAVVAALCILAVRAVIVQLAFFLHIQASLPVASSLMQTNLHESENFWDLQLHSHVKFLWNSNCNWYIWFVVSIIFLTVCSCKSTRPLFSEDQQFLRGHWCLQLDLWRSSQL